MKIEIREFKSEGVMQITTADERWYIMPDGKEYPNVTWIADCWPKGVYFYRWLASKGWNEAEHIKNLAGEKGSRVHHAVNDLLRGNPVALDGFYPSNEDGENKELSAEELDSIISFADWFEAVKPKVLFFNKLVANEEMGYAGVLDLYCEIGGVRWLIDFKTGQNVWMSAKLQVNGYKLGLPYLYGGGKFGSVKLGILQLGYGANKRGYKLTEVADSPDLWMAVFRIWKEEFGNIKPKQKDYPRLITLPSLVKPKKLIKAIKQKETKNVQKSARKVPKKPARKKL